MNCNLFTVIVDLVMIMVFTIILVEVKPAVIPFEYWVGLGHQVGEGGRGQRGRVGLGAQGGS